MKLTIKEMQAIETEMLKEVIEICEKNNINYFLAYGSALGAIRHKGPIPWDADLDITIPLPQLDAFLNAMRKNLSEKFYIDFYDSNKNYNVTFPRVGLKDYSTRLLHIDIYLLSGTPNNKSKQIKHREKIINLNSIFYWKKYKLKNGNSFKHKLFILYKKALFLKYNTKKIISEISNLREKYSYYDSEYISNSNMGYGIDEIIDKDIFGKGVLVDYDDLKVRVPEKYDAYLRHFYGDYMQLPPEKDRIIKDTYTINKVKL